MKGNRRSPVPPGTYAGNYADEHGAVLHGKHPWAQLPSVMRETQRQQQLLTLEFAVLQAFIRRFPGNPGAGLTTLDMLKLLLGETQITADGEEAMS